jgi:hypothetical protein
MARSTTEVQSSLLRQAYDMVLNQWPAEIKPGPKTFHINGGCNMRTLNEAHAVVEDWLSVTHFNASLESIISHVELCLFQTIHSALKNLTVMKKTDIDYEAFKSRFEVVSHGVV